MPRDELRELTTRWSLSDGWAWSCNMHTQSTY